MDLIPTEILIQNLSKISPLGYEVTIRNGLLRSTKCIYQNENLIYLFDISEPFKFKMENGYTEVDFNLHYKDWFWKIEQTIS